MNRLLLKFKENADFDKVHTEISTYLEETNIGFRIWDFRDHQKSLE